MIEANDRSSLDPDSTLDSMLKGHIELLSREYSFVEKKK